tara:strand:+ start:412 stop:576 length:165 start_codon:yes stop_codon:yes gene_type:complete
MKFHIKTVETVLIEYIIEADTVEEAKEVAMEGCAKPYKTELFDGVEVIQAEAIK